MTATRVVKLPTACFACALALAGVFPAAAQDDPEAVAMEEDCPNAPAILPNAGTWLMAASLMDVGGVSMPLGGGADLPWVFLQDCGSLLVAEITGLGQVALRLEGTSRPDLLSELKKGDTLVPEVYSTWLEEALDRGLPGPNVPATYYSGTLRHESRIWWVLAVTNSGSMRSVLGFAFVSEGGADPAPPHTQVHDWAYWKNEKPTDDEREKLEALVKESLNDAKQESLLAMLLQALGISL